jgi:hypothetical protein
LELSKSEGTFRQLPLPVTLIGSDLGLEKEAGTKSQGDHSAQSLFPRSQREVSGNCSWSPMLRPWSWSGCLWPHRSKSYGQTGETKSGNKPGVPLPHAPGLSQIYKPSSMAASCWNTCKYRTPRGHRCRRMPQVTHWQITGLLITFFLCSHAPLRKWEKEWVPLV